MYKNNSGFIPKNKVSKHKLSPCFSKNLAFQNPLLFLYKNVGKHKYNLKLLK